MPGVHQEGYNNRMYTVQVQLTLDQQLYGLSAVAKLVLNRKKWKDSSFLISCKFTSIAYSIKPTYQRILACDLFRGGKSQ